MAKSRAKSKAQIDRMSWPAQQRRYAFLGSIAPGSWDGKLDAELAYLESSLASGDYEPKASRLTWTSKNNGWEHHAKGGGYSFIIREHPEDFGEFFTLEQFRGSRPVGGYEDMHTLAEAKLTAQRAVDMPREARKTWDEEDGPQTEAEWDAFDEEMVDYSDFRRSPVKKKPQSTARKPRKTTSRGAKWPKPFGSSGIQMRSRDRGDWPKVLGTSKLGASDPTFAAYSGPLLQEGAEIERVDSGSRTHCWQLTTRDGGFDTRSGPFTKKYALDEIRQMSTPDARTKTKKAPSKSTGLAAKYDSYRKSWRSSPALVKRFKKGKSPPRS